MRMTRTTVLMMDPSAPKAPPVTQERDPAVLSETESGDVESQHHSL